MLGEMVHDGGGVEDGAIQVERYDRFRGRGGRHLCGFEAGEPLGR